MFRVLFRLAREEQVLAVIDGFPLLPGTTRTQVDRTLSSIQAVVEEERDRSRLKLVVCGSAVTQMEALQTQRSPLHGRLVPLELGPLPYWRAGHVLSGSDAQDRFDKEIAPELANDVAPVFEALCREHVRATMGATATRVGRWWGNSLDEHRRSGERTTEQIDVVGTTRQRVTLVGEATWASRPLGERILHDLMQYKIPALAQAGSRLAGEPTIVLFSRSGYTDGLRARAEADGKLVLVDVESMLSRLDPSGRTQTSR